MTELLRDQVATLIVAGLHAAQEKGALQSIQGPVNGPDTCERPEIIAIPVARAPMFGDLWRRMIPGEQNIRKGFVVAHQDIETRLHLLDVIGLEQKRFGFRRRRDEDHRRR